MGKIIDFIVADCKRFENYPGFSSILKRFVMYPHFRVLCYYRVLSFTGMGGAFVPV